MADADLFVRLGLKTEAYTRGIADARNATKQMESVVSGMRAALGKVAAAVGVAGGAYEAFNRTIQASQTTADAYDVAIAGAKAATEEFFQTLATGDWSNFIENMKFAITHGEELQRVLDSLGDKTDALLYVKSSSRVAIAKARDIINSTGASKAQKEEALKRAETDVDLQIKIADGMAKDAEQAFLEHVRAATGLDVTQKHIRHYHEGILSELDEGFQKYQSQKEEIERKISELSKTAEYTPAVSRGGFGAGMGFGVSTIKSATQAKIDALRAEEKQLNETNKEYAIYFEMNKVYTDPERKVGVEYRTKQAEAEEFAYTQRASLSKLRKKVYGDAGSSAKAALTEIQKLDKQIGALKDKLHKLPETATDKIKDIQGRIKKLEGKKLRLDVITKVSPDKLLKQVGPMVKPFEVPIVAAAASIDKIRKQIERIEAKLKFTIDPKEVKKLQEEKKKLEQDSNLLKENFDLKVPKSALKKHNKEAKETIDTNKKVVDSFNAISNVISSISGDAEEGAAAFFRWGASVASAIGTAVPAITALTAAKKAEATATAANAGAKAGESVAGVPIVGPVMAVAAIASVFAALASLPKFATGGIVGGSSYYGDKILARLNSGEMVLNQRQINTLGGILANEGRNQGGKVEFVIRGQELVGILDKYSRRQNRT